jgi:hypothetical protein
VENTELAIFYCTNWRMPNCTLPIHAVLDFRKQNLYDAIIDFQNRERRFGKTGKQIQEVAPLNS